MLEPLILCVQKAERDWVTRVELLTAIETGKAIIGVNAGSNIGISDVNHTDCRV